MKKHDGTSPRRRARREGRDSAQQRAKEEDSGHAYLHIDYWYSCISWSLTAAGVSTPRSVISRVMLSGGV